VALLLAPRNSLLTNGFAAVPNGIEVKLMGRLLKLARVEREEQIVVFHSLRVVTPGGNSSHRTSRASEAGNPWYSARKHREVKAAMVELSVTQLLHNWHEGDEEAFEDLVPIVYHELHRLARHYMRGERARHELQTTALIHEAYLRLVDAELGWQSRQHFFAVAAGVMRRVLADYARRHNAAKRGGGKEALSLDDHDVAAQPDWYLVALDDALKDLEEFDRNKSQIIELRYFGGLSIDDTAATLGLSRSVVDRELKMAKAWLHQQIRR